MNVKLRKSLGIVCIGTIIAGAMTVNAAQLSRTAKLVYNNIKVKVDGQYQAPSMEPFFIGDSVYVSLRDAGQLTKNSVQWDSANQTVEINTGNQNISVSEQELAEKNAEIMRLRAQVKMLEEQVEKENVGVPSKEETTSNKNIEDILSNIKDDYNFKHDISWTYELKKDGQNSLVFTIKYDSDRDGDDFNRLSEGTLKNLVQTMVKEIQEEYGEVSITGKVYDKNRSETAATFRLSDKGSFNFNYEKKSNYDQKDLEDYQIKLKQKYEKFPEIKFGSIYDGTSIRLKKIELTETNGTIEFGIYCTFMDMFSYAWNGVEEGSATSKLEAYMDNIQDAIEDEFDVRGVRGYLYNADGRVMAEYANGDITLRTIK